MVKVLLAGKFTIHPENNEELMQAFQQENGMV